MAEKCPISCLTPFQKFVIESFLSQFLSKLFKLKRCTSVTFRALKYQITFRRRESQSSYFNSHITQKYAPPLQASLAVIDQERHSRDDSLHFTRVPTPLTSCHLSKCLTKNLVKTEAINLCLYKQSLTLKKGISSTISTYVLFGN